MALKANVKEGVVSLWTAKQRSLLALIGIVIGIGSVIAMLSVGTIAKRQARDQFRELGTDFLAIQVHGGAPGGASTIRLQDVVALPQETAAIMGVAPWSRSREAWGTAARRSWTPPPWGSPGRSWRSTGCGCRRAAASRTWTFATTAASSAPGSPPHCGWPARRPWSTNRSGSKTRSASSWGCWRAPRGTASSPSSPTARSSSPCPPRSACSPGRD